MSDRELLQWTGCVWVARGVSLMLRDPARATLMLAVGTEMMLGRLPPVDILREVCDA